MLLKQESRESAHPRALLWERKAGWRRARYNGRAYQPQSKGRRGPEKGGRKPKKKHDVPPKKSPFGCVCLTVSFPCRERVYATKRPGAKETREEAGKGGPISHTPSVQTLNTVTCTNKPQTTRSFLFFFLLPLWLVRDGVFLGRHGKCATL